MAQVLCWAGLVGELSEFNVTPDFRSRWVSKNFTWLENIQNAVSQLRDRYEDIHTSVKPLTEEC